jgi:hypothetical protein
MRKVDLGSTPKALSVTLVQRLQLDRPFRPSLRSAIP